MKIDIARPYLDALEQQAAADAIASGWVAQGPKVREFEEAFAAYAGARFAIAMTSCTTALHSALVISGVGPGDEVIVPSLSFIATANSVVHCGARPVFVDVVPETCNIDPSKLEGAITKKTKAVMPVHQMGMPVDIDAIAEIAKRHNLKVVEDAACAIGSEYKGKRIGSHGNTACFSFHPRKVITTGEGGMITTDDPEFAARCRRFRHHGMSVSDLDRHSSDKIITESYLEVAYNYRMTDIQAAMGIVQLAKLPEILRKRVAIAARYDNAFSRIACLRVPSAPSYANHNYQSYWVEVMPNAPITRDGLMERLLEAGVSTRRGIMAIHKEPCYSSYRVELPMTERMSANSVILPLYPSMTDLEIEFVIESVSSIMR